MSRRYHSILLLVGTLFLGGIRAQYDPVKNFCKRMDHQTAIAGDTLYIDGGLEWFHTDDKNDTVLGINTGLVRVDMSTNWNWRNKDFPQSVIKKKRVNGGGGDYVPNLIRGSLWPNKDGSALYMYGGTTSMENTSFVAYEDPRPDKPNLWKFDVETERWSPVEPAEGSASIIRLSDGAGVAAPDINKAYYFGGEIDRGSRPGTEDLTSPRYTPGLLEFDWETETVRNLSTDALGNRPTANAQMVYLPNYGSQGVLVAIGGEQKSNLIVDLDGHWRGDPVSMKQITIYDIAEDTWYIQQATGYLADQIPPDRTDHCIVAVPAPDMSSYNIYMYGGWSDDAQYDDIWVLSIPTFQWIRIFVGQSPRFGHTCHVVGNRQMLTVGGVGKGFQMNDSNCDWETESVAIYDLTTLQWGSTFTYEEKPYQLPVEINHAIGGNSSGYAEKVKPANWGSDGVQKLFAKANIAGPTPQATASATALPESTSTKKSSAGPIIGGVVGGVVIVALLICGVFVFKRRKERKDRLLSGAGMANDGHYDPRKAELDGNAGTYYSELDANAAGAHRRSRLPVPEVQEMAGAHHHHPELERQELPGDYEWVHERKSAITSTTEGSATSPVSSQRYS